MSRWQGATVGRDSKTMGIRLTEEEEQRLEALRQEFRLTSKGQVIRAALDLLEGMGAVSDVVVRANEEQRELTRRAGRRIRRHYGVPRRADVEAAPVDDTKAKKRKVVDNYRHVTNPPVVAGGPEASECGSPASDVQDPGQLQLPEMPARSVSLEG